MSSSPGPSTICLLPSETRYLGALAITPGTPQVRYCIASYIAT